MMLGGHAAVRTAALLCQRTSFFRMLTLNYAMLIEQSCHQGPAMLRWANMLNALQGILHDVEDPQKDRDSASSPVTAFKAGLHKMVSTLVVDRHSTLL